MASSLPMEKLDRSNYASWTYKLHQYLLGHGYWSYVNGVNNAAPESTHSRLSGLGTGGNQSSLLLRVLCERPTSELHSGCKDAKGCLGKSEEDFRREHHNQKAPTQARVEQCATTRYVGG